MKQNILLVITAIFLMYVSSCKRDDMKVEIPSYIIIDSVHLSTDSLTQGTNHQAYSSVNVFANGKEIGIFDIPAKFPVLAKGNTDFFIRPWIKKSGVTTQKADYYHVKSYETELFLTEGEEHHIIPQFEYKDAAKIHVEDFDGPGILFHTNDSVNFLRKIEDPDKPGNKIGLVDFSISDKENIIGFTFFTKLKLPYNGKAMFLEMDYKCDSLFGVGILLRYANNSLEFKDPFTLVKPSPNKWKKMYIDIGEQIVVVPGAKSYEVFFYVPKNGSSASKLYLDNIKILTF